MPPSSPAGIECAYALRCECTHLTSFGGVAIPTSLDDILAQLEPTITLPCPDGFFAPYTLSTSRTPSSDPSRSPTSTPSLKSNPKPRPNPTPSPNRTPSPSLSLTRFIYEDSPLLYSLILGLTVLNLLSIGFFRFRYPQAG